MGFRGCDESFAKGLELATSNPGEFRAFVRELIAGMKKREEAIKANAEIFLKKYGIKYCPFHSNNLVKNVLPDSVRLKVDGINYSFDSAACSFGEFCKTPVSFDSDLIRRLSNTHIKEVEIDKRFNACTTCGDKRGKAYLVGFRSPVQIKEGIPIKKSKEYLNDIRVYLFDKSGSCGHSYVFMQSLMAPRLKLKRKKTKIKSGLIFRM